ncbi:hypothetical protein ACF0H5_008730 [Mactra antiquata]
MIMFSCHLFKLILLAQSLFTITSQFNALDYLIHLQATRCPNYSTCPDDISEQEAHEPCCKRTCFCDEPCPYDNCCLKWSVKEFSCMYNDECNDDADTSTVWPSSDVTQSFAYSTNRHISYFMSCHDAKLIINQLSTESKRTSSYLVVDECPNGFTSKDNEIKSKCEMINTNDSMINIHVPVFSLDTDVSFRNVFCYYCHEGIQSSNYIHWIVTYMCPQSTPLDILREINFDPDELFKRFISNEFGSCNLLYSPPGRKTQYNLDCMPYYKFTCINHTSQYILNDICVDFKKTIDGIQRLYPEINDKNIDCALCSKPNLTVIERLCNQSFLERPEYYIDVIGVNYLKYHHTNDVFDPIIPHDDICMDGFIYDSYLVSSLS